MATVKVDAVWPPPDETLPSIKRKADHDVPRHLLRRSVSPSPYASRESRDQSSNSRSSGRQSASPPIDDTRISPHGMTQSIRYPSVHSSASASASGTATAGSTSSRGQTGEDPLTLRRREANRLAAQRFRSRKKGYQDSLEEKIRLLEEEKDAMTRRRDVGRQRSPREETYLRHQHQDLYRRESVSPVKGADVDVRVASLESANRCLQDELRVLAEENERMREELERWRRWERDLRDPRREEDRYSRGASTLPPLDVHMPPPQLTSSPYPPYPARSPHPPLERGLSYSSSSSRLPPSPGPRLPPLRLPHEVPLHTLHARPLLPRPESMERLNNGHPLHSPHLSPDSRRD